MSIALWTKNIRCPNCKFEGKAKVKGTGGWLFLIAIILFLIGIVFWLLLILVPILILIAIFRPAKQICPNCKWEHPIPL